jgi:hypothetical protein
MASPALWRQLRLAASARRRILAGPCSQRRGVASAAELLVHERRLPCQRHLFAALPPAEDICYLNAAYMSPALAAAEAAGVAGARAKSTPWAIGGDDFYAGVERLRAAAGRLVGAAPDDVALIPSASYGLAVNGPGSPLDHLHLRGPKPGVHYANAGGFY